MTLHQRLYELGYPNYAAYLRSAHWRALRRRYCLTAHRDRLGRLLCTQCAQAGELHLHHKNYRNLGQEQEDDLVLLCRTCHESVHGHELGRSLRQPRDVQPPMLWQVIRAGK